MLISQSGALVTGILDWMSLNGLGLSHAVTLGNRLDISENDCLAFAANDPHTHQILVYIESFHDAPRFFAAASTISPKKPIILLKGGTTDAGQTASASHTAALATNQVLVEAFAKQTGVMLCSSYSSWLSTATFEAESPDFKGNHLAIITNAGGPGVLVADALTKSGLIPTTYDSKTIKALKQSLPLTSYGNPLDILGDAPPERYEQAVKIIAKDPKADAIATIMTPQTSTKPKQAAEAIAKSLLTYRKPKAAIIIGGTKLKPAVAKLREHKIPVFMYPDEAVAVIGAKATYDHLKQTLPVFPHKITLSPPIITHAQPQLEFLFHVLDAYGFTLPKYSVIDSLYKVSEALEYVGRPAVVKTAALRIPHKAKVGGVRLNIMTTQAARLAFRQLSQLDQQVLFQQTVYGQLELILGAKRDPVLGPFITFGLGGTLTNILDDRAYAFIPAASESLEAAFNGTKASQACEELNLNHRLVIDAITKLSRLMLDHPNIEEMEINPAILSSKQLYVADFKIILNTG
jgi:acetyltransferase